MAKDLLDHIQDIILSNSLLNHPFYLAWTNGTLPIEALRLYAGQYYHFEAAYPTFLSGLHHRCADPLVRQSLLNNLWDEEHGSDNHAELWLRFCDALGMDRATTQAGPILASTKTLTDTYTHLTTTAPLAAGVAALYAFESQVSEIAGIKIEGLNLYYGINDESSVSFFRVHQSLDVDHALAEQDLITSLTPTEQEKNAAIVGVRKATEALWQFLDGVC